jgi:hypothetical protein
MGISRLRGIALSLLTALSIAGALALPGAASAGVADYTNDSSFGVPNNTGQAGIPSQVFVPPGRTPVQSLELTNVMPSFGAGGGTDIQLRLKGPTGTEIQLLSNSQCTFWPNTSAFTISDSAATDINSAGFCSGQLPTGSGKPTDPLSTFAGSPSGGTWTVTVVDLGINTTQGSWNGWTLRLTHAPPTLAASRSKLKVKGRLAFNARCDANCTVRAGGAVKPKTQKLLAGSPGLIVAKPTRKARRRLRSHKPVRVKLTATDETGGTATATIRVKRGR